LLGIVVNYFTVDVVVLVYLVATAMVGVPGLLAVSMVPVRVLEASEVVEYEVEADETT